MCAYVVDAFPKLFLKCPVHESQHLKQKYSLARVLRYALLLLGSGRVPLREQPRRKYLAVFSSPEYLEYVLVLVVRAELQNLVFHVQIVVVGLFVLRALEFLPLWLLPLQVDVVDVV